MKVNILSNNCCEIKTTKGTYLQSYSTIVAFRDYSGFTVFPKWDYSRTTARHVSQWIGFSSKEIRKKIKEGKIKVKDEPEL